MDQASEQSFPGSGLAEQEHGRVHRGVLERGVPHPREGRALGHDLVQVQGAPQPPSQPNIAEATAIGPADRVQADAHDLSILRRRGRLVLREERQLFGLAVPVVEGDGALPASFLLRVEFAEMRHDLPGGGRRLVMPAKGICFIVVNGQVLYEEGKHTGAMPGQVLRAIA